jgi:Spy/CpxP family protein refolding chaperone
MRSALIGGALLVLALPAFGQQRGPMMQPPPDHWMTLDSLVQAAGITDAQKPDVEKHYDALNAVMKKAADERRAMRERMMAGGGPPSQEEMQANRDKMQGMQAELDRHYTAIRDLLTPEQQAKFDALAKPRVMMMGPGMRRPPGA